MVIMIPPVQHDNIYVAFCPLNTPQRLFLKFVHFPLLILCPSLYPYTIFNYYSNKFKFSTSLIYTHPKGDQHSRGDLENTNIRGMGTIKLKYVTLLLVLAVVRGTDAATYVVGDSLGWNIPNGGAATYATWAAQHTYATGDILVFNFTTGAHDVATVKKPSFDSCSSTSPLALQTISPANVTLTTSGTHYFICTFGQHCSKGQKLTVNVTSTSVGPPASPPTAATPPPTAATPPPTAATPSTPPTAASPTTPPPAASPTTPPTAASPTTPPTAPSPVTPPAASPAPKGSAPTPGPIVGGGPTPAASPGPGVSAPVPSTGGGPTPPPSPTTATPPGSSTSPPPTGGSVSPPPPSSASRKAVAALAIGLVLAVMGVVC